jgi:hypothetical protein
MARYNGENLYSWKFLLLEPGVFGRKEIICSVIISHPLVRHGREDSEKNLAY